MILFDMKHRRFHVRSYFSSEHTHESTVWATRNVDESADGHVGSHLINNPREVIRAVLGVCSQIDIRLALLHPSAQSRVVTSTTAVRRNEFTAADARLLVPSSIVIWMIVSRMCRGRFSR